MRLAWMIVAAAMWSSIGAAGALAKQPDVCSDKTRPVGRMPDAWTEPASEIVA